MLFELFKFGLFEYGLKRIPAYFRKFLKMQIVILVNVVRGIVYLFDIFLCRPLKWLCVYFGKRGELRYREILPAPKPSSLSKVLMYLSSPLLLVLNKWRKVVFSSSLPCLSNISSLSNLARVFMDPRNKSEDDERVCVFEDDCYKKNEAEDDQRERWLEDDFTLKSSLRADRRSQAIYELEKRGLIGGSLDDCCRNRGMTIKKYALQKIGMTISLFFMFLFSFLLVSNSSHAAVCFLPDCALALKKMEFIPDGAGSCVGAGYVPLSEVECPEYSQMEMCPENGYYVRCNNTRWCMANGYELATCTEPYYVSQQCPNGEELYLECVEDLERACRELDNEYVLECPTGYAHDVENVCPYSEDYTKCCNLCEGYDYTQDNVGLGYVLGDSCVNCDGVTKYKRKPDPCVGYQYCSNGGENSANMCMHGTEKWYTSCCDSMYQYSCSGTGYFGGAGTSCSGKYTSCFCATTYNWTNGVCAYCGDAYKHTCDGNNTIGGVGESCGGMYTACECEEGYEWSGRFCHDPSCKVGAIYYSDETCSSVVDTEKTIVGFVVKENERVMSIDMSNLSWYTQKYNIVDIPETTGVSDYNGKHNTGAIVGQLGQSGDWAGSYCYNYNPTVKSSKNKWYLPAIGELSDVAMLGDIVDNVWFTLDLDLTNKDIWSSSEWTGWTRESMGLSWYFNGKYYNSSEKTSTYNKYAACMAAIDEDGKLCSAEYVNYCEGNGYLSGVGDSCSGAYKECSCKDGYEWNGKICKQKCAIGEIFYSDGTCSNVLDSSKTAVGLIVKPNELVMSIDLKKMQWGVYGTDVSTLTNVTSDSGVRGNYTGKEDTTAMVSALGSTASDSYAGIYCYNYAPVGMESSKGKWYLPSIADLYNDVVPYANLFSKWYSTILGSYSSSFWTSYEYDANKAWYLSLSLNSYSRSTSKKSTYSAACITEISNLCATEYKHVCKGAGYISGKGDYCGGLFKECNCVEGYEWNGSSCYTDLCLVGSIYYADGTCSTDIVSGKTAVGIVVKDHELIMSTIVPSLSWSTKADAADIPALSNSLADTGWTGIDNTKIIVDYYGVNADTSTHAGVYCYNFAPTGLTSSKGRWYLPGGYELTNYFYPHWALTLSRILPQFGVSISSSDDIWTSSEYSQWDAPKMSIQGGSLLSTFGGTPKATKYPVVCYAPIDANNNICDARNLYSCEGEGYVAGIGSVCGGKYSECSCDSGYVWNGSGCCETAYQYACTGTGVQSGIGDTCGGKYTQCQCALGHKWNGSDCSSCADGATLNNGNCVCDTSCAVGNIYYSDGSCNSCLDSSKTAVGVVVKENALVMSLDKINMYWSPEYVDIKGIRDRISAADAKSDIIGKANTWDMVEQVGATDKHLYASVYCYNYAPSSMPNSKGAWYLPGAGELYNYVYNNYSKLKPTYVNTLGWNSFDTSFWSSSEYDEYYAWQVDSRNGSLLNVGKYSNQTVSCFLPLDGKGSFCDAEYKFSCDSANDKGGVGETCNGMYWECFCGSGYGWRGNSCTSCSADTSCSVGNIYYADETCNYCIDPNKEVLGIVVKENELIMATATKKLAWGDRNTYVGAIDQYNGVLNTTKIVNYYGDDKTNYAGVYCYNYNPAEEKNTKGAWYLPAYSELYPILYNNADTSNWLMIKDILSDFHVDFPSLSTSYSDFVTSYESKSSYTYYTPIMMRIDNYGKLTSASGSNYKDDEDIVLCFARISKNGICGVEYKHVCNGVGYASGKGDECGGLYVECNCNDGYEWSDGECCTTDCIDGSFLYTDGTCNSCLNKDKSVAGIILGDNLLSVGFVSKAWGINEKYVPTGSTGKEKTATIVAHYGESATQYAGVYCYNYAPSGLESTKGEWYLPLSSELKKVYKYSAVLEAMGNAHMMNSGGYYWSSSVSWSSRTVADGVNIGTGYVYTYPEKSYTYNVICYMPISTMCDDTYQYGCSGSQYDSGVGLACDGLYKSCNCAVGYEWKDGSCQLCSSLYEYTCSGTNITGGVGESCGSLYGSCSCADGYWWNNGQCCGNDYKYSCSGTGYKSGVGTACNGMYTSCTCAEKYTWSNGICAYCGDSYKYTCSGVGYASGVGETCGGFYSECSCAAGATMNNGVCECDKSCTIGNIYYTDGTCSSCLDSSKNVAGVIVSESPLMLMSADRKTMNWSSLDEDVSGLTNIISLNNVQKDVNGVTNTQKIVEHFGSDNNTVAAVYCANYAPTGATASKGQWYLPAVGELVEHVYLNYDELYSTYMDVFGWNSFSYYFWSSSEYGGSFVWNVHSSSGEVTYDYRTNAGSVGCFLSINCAEGYKWKEGACVESCSVGKIYYSDDTCSSSVVSGKTAIGVVVKDNELVLSQKSSSTMTWGTRGTDISGLTNYSSSTDAKADYNGKSNTAAIIAGDSGAVAAKYCNDYTTAGTSAGDWYLPAAGELYSYVYGNYNAINTAMTAIGWTFDSAYFWSSSEYSSGGAWTVGSRNGYMYAFNKTYDDSVSCFLDISGG